MSFELPTFNMRPTSRWEDFKSQKFSKHKHRQNKRIDSWKTKKELCSPSRSLNIVNISNRCIFHYFQTKKKKLKLLSFEKYIKIRKILLCIKYFALFCQHTGGYKHIKNPKRKYNKNKRSIWSCHTRIFCLEHIYFLPFLSSWNLKSFEIMKITTIFPMFIGK